MTKRDAAGGRESRLSSALRDNLRRRKAASRPADRPDDGGLASPQEIAVDKGDKPGKG